MGGGAPGAVTLGAYSTRGSSDLAPDASASANAVIQIGPTACESAQGAATAAAARLATARTVLRGAVRMKVRAGHRLRREADPAAAAAYRGAYLRARRAAGALRRAASASSRASAATRTACAT